MKTAESVMFNASGAKRAEDGLAPESRGRSAPSPLRPGSESLRQAEKRHFWFAGRNARIVAYLKQCGLEPPSRVVEVGCGRGAVLNALVDRGYSADGIEMHRGLCEEAAKDCPSATIHCMDVTRGDRLTVLGRYACVGIFDVLEHAPQPAELLQACGDLLVPDGLLVGTVPALMSLWSSLDDVSGHQIRYERATLRRDLEGAGFEVVDIRYFFQGLVPILWWQRRGLRATRRESFADQQRIVEEGLKVPSAAANFVGKALCNAERMVGSVFPLGFLPGASLLFSCRIR